MENGGLDRATEKPVGPDAGANGLNINDVSNDDWARFGKGLLVGMPAAGLTGYGCYSLALALTPVTAGISDLVGIPACTIAAAIVGSKVDSIVNGPYPEKKK